jgi:ferric-dicitrate binding protein FerR (iron transport regulator)
MALTQNQKDAFEAKRTLDKAQTAILNALKLAWPALYAEPPKKEISSGSRRKLTRRQTDAGVRALMLACNLAGGSTGDIQLYDLLDKYLRDPEARQEINRVVRCA